MAVVRDASTGAAEAPVRDASSACGAKNKYIYRERERDSTVYFASVTYAMLLMGAYVIFYMGSRACLWAQIFLGNLLPCTL